MKTKYLLYVLCVLPHFHCELKGNQSANFQQNKTPQNVSEIAIPEGFERLDSIDKFHQYLINLPLKKDNKVYLFNGELKGNQNAQFAVLALPIMNKDLEQCADAVIRLRAEFLYTQKRFNDIHFNFTSGDNAQYSEYIKGFRPKINGNKVSWIKSATEKNDRKTFQNYLTMVYSYAGTASLHKEMLKNEMKNMKAGNVLIQTKNPFGHAIMVMSVIKNKKTGALKYMLAQSYMPAQEMHILKNYAANNSPWFDVNDNDQIATPEWYFTTNDLKKWEN